VCVYVLVCVCVCVCVCVFVWWIESRFSSPIHAMHPLACTLNTLTGRVVLTLFERRKTQAFFGLVQGEEKVRRGGREDG
jgi:hypothetical protein